MDAAIISLHNQPAKREDAANEVEERPSGIESEPVVSNVVPRAVNNLRLMDNGNEKGYSSTHSKPR